MRRYLGIVILTISLTCQAGLNPKFLIKNAENGNLESQLELANMYLEGVKIERDLKKSRYWFEKAAEQGDLSAQLKLAQMLGDGVGGPIDLTQRVNNLQKASKHGNGEAQYWLAIAYYEGKGVKANPEKAAELIAASRKNKYTPPDSLGYEYQFKYYLSLALSKQSPSLSDLKDINDFPTTYYTYYSKFDNTQQNQFLRDITQYTQQNLPPLIFDYFDELEARNDFYKLMFWQDAFEELPANLLQNQLNEISEDHQKRLAKLSTGFIQRARDDFNTRISDKSAKDAFFAAISFENIERKQRHYDHPLLADIKEERHAKIKAIANELGKTYYPKIGKSQTITELNEIATSLRLRNELASKYLDYVVVLIEQRRIYLIENNNFLKKAIESNLAIHYGGSKYTHSLSFEKVDDDTYRFSNIILETSSAVFDAGETGTFSGTINTKTGDVMASYEARMQGDYRICKTTVSLEHKIEDVTNANQWRLLQQGSKCRIPLVQYSTCTVTGCGEYMSHGEVDSVWYLAE